MDDPTNCSFHKSHGFDGSVMDSTLTANTVRRVGKRDAKGFKSRPSDLTFPSDPIIVAKHQPPPWLVLFFVQINVDVT